MILLRLGHNGIKLFKNFRFTCPPPCCNRFFGTILSSSSSPSIVGQNLKNSDVSQSQWFSNHCDCQPTIRLNDLPASDDVFIISSVESLSLSDAPTTDALFSERVSSGRKIRTLKNTPSPYACRHF